MATRKGTVLLMARPFFPWMGNKEKLVPYIHQLIPPHVKQFTEVFGGSGAVILGLQPKKGRLDIYHLKEMANPDDGQPRRDVFPSEQDTACNIH